MDPVWILLSTRDDGKTWKIEQPYRMFKSRLRAEWTAHESNSTHLRVQFKVVEFRPVEQGGLP